MVFVTDETVLVFSSTVTAVLRGVGWEEKLVIAWCDAED